MAANDGPDRPTALETLGLTQARRLDSELSRFVADWRAGGRPRIEDYLGDHDGPSRQALLRSLIARELELHDERGTPRPEPSTFEARFPADPEAVASAYAAAAPPPGRLGDYLLLGEIARGGMGVVYKARQLSLNRTVALKTLRAGRLATADEARRFRIEAEAAAGLDHPNIVPIYEVGEHDGLHYFSMKLVEGGSLAAWAARRDAQGPRLDRDDQEAVARLVAAVARAVDYAHRRGFVHRDLKPANVLIDADGRPLVTDFGLARRVAVPGEPGDSTARGTLVGTPAFMAPEQARADGPAGPSADVYSLGAVLYALLTGRPPFRAETVMETIVRVLEREPVPPSRLRPGLHRDLELVALKCLEKRPEDRYPSAAALADDLDRFLRGEPAEARRAGPIGRLRRWSRREPELASRLVGLALITALTQLNYALETAPDPRLHLQVTAIELAWIAAAFALQIPARRGDPWAGRVRPARDLIDVALLTALLWRLDAGSTMLIVGYPLLIASSGLAARPGLVWLTTAAASIGFTALSPFWRLRVDGPFHYSKVVLAILLVTGWVVAHQAARFRALSRFYEHGHDGQV